MVRHLVACIKFHAAPKARGVYRNTHVFKSPFQPYTAYVALIFFSIIILFNGYDSFRDPETEAFDITGFATAYVGIVIYFGLSAI